MVYLSYQCSSPPPPTHTPMEKKAIEKETWPMSRKWQERGSRGKLQRMPHGEEESALNACPAHRASSQLNGHSSRKIYLFSYSCHLSLPRRPKELAEKLRWGVGGRRVKWRNRGETATPLLSTGFSPAPEGGRFNWIRFEVLNLLLYWAS